MSRRVPGLPGVLAGATAIALLAVSCASGQERSSPGNTATPANTSVAVNTKSSANKWTLPRTADGQPDLEGIWSNATLTPLERPPELAGKQFLTEKEAAEFEKQVLQRENRDRREADPEADFRAYNEAWYERGTEVVASRRTSLILDPPDGLVPPRTPEGQKREDEAICGTNVHGRCKEPGFDSWEERGLWERCITRGLPYLPGPYNNNYQIFQTPGYVAIYSEMIHDARIIPLDGRPHIAKNIHQWLGDSRGHWEGNTLVVDTTNFSDRASFKGSGSTLHLIERFTRTGADTLLYEFTVDDPATFTRKWTAAVPMTRAPGPIYEYACHEGNYALPAILAGARAEEKAAAERAAKSASK